MHQHLLAALDALLPLPLPAHSPLSLPSNAQTDIPTVIKSILVLLNSAAVVLSESAACDACAGAARFILHLRERARLAVVLRYRSAAVAAALATIAASNCQKPPSTLINRVTDISRDIGLECFADQSVSGTSLTLAGSIVVIDIDFSSPDTVQRVQVSYADRAGAPLLDQSASSLLKNSLTSSFDQFVSNLHYLRRLDSCSIPSFDCFTGIKNFADDVIASAERLNIGSVRYNDTKCGLYIEYSDNCFVQVSYEAFRPPSDNFDMDIPPLLTPTPKSSNQENPLLVACLHPHIWVPWSLARRLCELMDAPSTEFIHSGPDNSLETVWFGSLALSSQVLVTTPSGQSTQTFTNQLVENTPMRKVERLLIHNVPQLAQMLALLRQSITFQQLLESVFNEKSLLPPDNLVSDEDISLQDLLDTDALDHPVTIIPCFPKLGIYLAQGGLILSISENGLIHVENCFIDHFTPDKIEKMFKITKNIPIITAFISSKLPSAGSK